MTFLPGGRTGKRKGGEEYDVAGLAGNHGENSTSRN
jgi:hypothetical protein